MSVLHALRPKAAPSSERKCIKKRVEKYLPSEQRQDAVHQEAELYFTFQLSQLHVNLPVIHWPHNLIMTLQEIYFIKDHVVSHMYAYHALLHPKICWEQECFLLYSDSTDKTMGGNCGSQRDHQAHVEGQVWQELHNPLVKKTDYLCWAHLR